MDKIKQLNLDELNISISNNNKVLSFLLSDNLLNEITNNQQTVDTIAFIRNGFPKESVTRVIEKTDLPAGKIFNILHIGFPQPAYYNDDEKLSVEQSNFLYEFARLYLKGLDVFGDKQTFDHWLNRPNLALGEKTPLELLDTIEGFRLVENVLAQIEYGFYS